jgi:hypothetical protein
MRQDQALQKRARSARGMGVEKELQECCSMRHVKGTCSWKKVACHRNGLQDRWADAYVLWDLLFLVMRRVSDGGCDEAVTPNQFYMRCIRSLHYRPVETEDRMMNDETCPKGRLSRSPAYDAT